MLEKLKELEERVEKLEKGNKILEKLKEIILEWLGIKKSENKNEETDKKLQEELQNLKEKNEELKKEIEKLNSQLEKEKNDFQNELNKSEEENKKLKAKIEELDKPAKIKNLYNKLSEESQKGIILDEKNPYITGILNIERIWKYAEYLNRENKESDFKIVREIFYTLFDECEGIYSYQKVEIGEEYDIDKFTKDSKSEEMSGKVDEVLLKGFLKDDKIIQKSIVKVK